MIDPIKLQRLIDGELDNSARSSLLRSAEEQNDHWREIALAFIEDQEFRTGLREQLALSELAGTGSASDQQAPGATQPPASPNFGQRRGWAQWFCVAAALVLTCAVGYGLGKSADSPAGATAGVATSDDSKLTDDGLNLASKPNSSSTSRAATATDLQNSAADIVDINGNPMSIPVVDYEQGADFLNQPLVPASSKARWKESGFEVNENVRYISGRLEDGRQFVVPVRSVQFSPGQ